jgi:hypothetical protein
MIYLLTLPRKLDFELWETESPKFSRFLLSWSGQSVTTESEKSLSLNMSVLNGHIGVTKNPDFMITDVNEFRSDWLTMDGMSYIVTVFQEFLAKYHTSCSQPSWKVHKWTCLRISVCKWYAVERQ